MTESMLHDITQIEFSRYKPFAHAEKLQALASGDDVYPVTVEVDLVAYCNHGCAWCVDPMHDSHRLEMEFVTSLLDELCSLGVQGIVLKGGGEPMLYPEFTEALAYAHGLGFDIGIVSNGSRLHECADVVAQCASYVRVSVDGPTPELHRRIHGSDDFDLIIQGVTDLVAARQAHGRRHPIIGLSFAMDDSGIAFVDEAVWLANDLKVDYVLFRPPFFEEVGRSSSLSWQGKQDLFAAFERASRQNTGPARVLIDYWISDKETNDLSKSGDSPRRGSFLQPGANGIEHVTGRCLATPLLAVVTADRHVYGCCNLRLLREWSMGTIDYSEGATFAQVWQSRSRAEIRQRMSRTECISLCTHPLSRYNEIIEYLRGPRFHMGFV